MPDRDWLPFALIAVAFVALAVIAWGFAAQPDCDDIAELLREDSYSDQEAGRKYSVTCERDCQIRFDFGGVSDEEGDNTEGKRGGECNNIAERDLVAQNVMAHWAKISAILAMVALMGLLWTLRETRRIGEAQVQAYLSLKSGIVMGIGDNTSTVDMQIENVGQSPAFKIKVEADVQIYSAITDGADDTKTFKTAGSETRVPEVIPAKSEREIRLFFRDPDGEFNRSMDDRKIFRVVAKISFNNVFGRRCTCEVQAYGVPTQKGIGLRQH